MLRAAAYALQSSINATNTMVDWTLSICPECRIMFCDDSLSPANPSAHSFQFHSLMSAIYCAAAKYFLAKVYSQLF